MTEKKFKHVCECTNCGNEAEMVVTCTLADESAEEVVPKVVPKKEGQGSQGEQRGQAEHGKL